MLEAISPHMWIFGIAIITLTGLVMALFPPDRP